MTEADRERLLEAAQLQEDEAMRDRVTVVLAYLLLAAMFALAIAS